MQFVGESQLIVDTVKTVWNTSEVQALGDLCYANAVQAEYAIGIIMLIIGILIGWQIGVRR